MRIGIRERVGVPPSPPATWALDFDGVDDYVQLGVTDSFFNIFQIDSKYTVETEVFIPEIPASNQAIWNAGVTGSNRHGLIITSTGYAVFGFYDGVNYTTVSQEISPGGCHIKCVNEEGSISLYIDEVSDPGPSQTVVIGAPSRLFRLGQNGGSTGHFTGRIRNVRLFDGSGLYGHWPTDEGYGTVLRDISPNKIHGQITGAGWVKVS